MRRRPRRTSPPGSRSTPQALASLGALLDGDRPRRWLVMGDSLLRLEPEPYARSSIPQRLSHFIHRKLERSGDLIIDCTRFGQKIKPSLVERVLLWLDVDDPDILVLLCGNRDAAQRIEGFNRFEDSLEELLTIIQHAERPVVINTPPCLRPERADHVDQQMYRESLLACAARHDAVIVDHWVHWCWAAQEYGSLAAWLGRNKEERTESGLDRVVQLIGNELTAARSEWDRRPSIPPGEGGDESAPLVCGDASLASER